MRILYTQWRVIKKVYAHMFMPCRDMSEWDKIANFPNVNPPKMRSKLGEKKKNRGKQSEDKSSRREG